MKQLKLRLHKLTFSLKDFMNRNIWKDDTITGSDLQKVYIYHIYPRDSKTTTGKGFVNIDNGQMGVIQWTCF